MHNFEAVMNVSPRYLFINLYFREKAGRKLTAKTYRFLETFEPQKKIKIESKDNILIKNKGESVLDTIGTSCVCSTTP